MIKINPPDEWRATATGIIKSLATRVPGLGEVIGGYDALRDRQREKAFQEFVETVLRRIDLLEAQGTEWYATEEGQQFAAKVIEGALDQQMAEKRELFGNALVSGAAQADLSVVEKNQFVDLLRHLSRMALDVLARMHTRFGPTVLKPGGERGVSTQTTAERMAEELSAEMRVDPYAIYAAVEEMISAGLLSRVGSWRRSGDGRATALSSYGTNAAYTFCEVHPGRIAPQL